MSRILIDTDNKKTFGKDSLSFGGYGKPKGNPAWKKILIIFGAALAAILLISGAGAYLYWQKVKTTPQYSLALLVDAARRDDPEMIERLVDTDAVVENFIPQITGKAAEMYGKGLPPAMLSKIAGLAAPFMPGLKQRARAELPKVIREKTRKFENVPYWMIALGADQVAHVKQEGETAKVSNDNPERPLELTMKRKDGIWQVVAIKDDKLAAEIAEKVGQQLMQAAARGNLKSIGEEFGVKGLEDILKKAQDIFR